MRRLTLLLLLAAGCAEQIDPPAGFEIDGYRTWALVAERYGAIPGHGDSYRTIFANDVARSHPRGGSRYEIGTILVKEIAADVTDASGFHSAGDLRYLAIMRKVGDDTDLPTFHGWLFTTAGDAGADEKHLDSCWQTCHKAAPFDGTWHEYGE
jgi:hypothetical protein